MSSSQSVPNGAPLSRQLNRQHPLFKLAHSIDWRAIEQQLGRVPCDEGGRPSLPTRLLAGLHYLKGMYDESDESVVSKWVENPYWQYFCGETTFQHHLPCHPTTLVKWRQHLGPDGMETLFKHVLHSAMRQGALAAKDIEQVNVDTTVQEKAISFPTDSRLYDKARRALVCCAKGDGVVLRQSYVRVGKRAIFQASRYRVAGQLKRAKRQTRKLRTILGRVIRDIERKVSQPTVEMQILLERASRIHQQKRSDSNKLYSVHAPEVECIAKGKVHKRYEFGCKVVLTTTSGSNWIVGADAAHGNPYDGATLKSAINQVQRVTGAKPKQAAVDKGFRGTKYHPSGLQVLVVGTRKVTGAIKRLGKRRCAIEPVIAHAKQDHALRRNYLQGKTGDRINAILVACGFNLRKLFRFFLEQQTELATAGA